MSENHSQEKLRLRLNFLLSGCIILLSKVFYVKYHNTNLYWNARDGILKCFPEKCQDDARQLIDTEHMLSDFIQGGHMDDNGQIIPNNIAKIVQIMS